MVDKRENNKLSSLLTRKMKKITRNRIREWESITTQSLNSAAEKRIRISDRSPLFEFIRGHSEKCDSFTEDGFILPRVNEAIVHATVTPFEVFSGTLEQFAIEKGLGSYNQKSVVCDADKTEPRDCRPLGTAVPALNQTNPGVDVNADNSLQMATLTSILGVSGCDLREQSRDYLDVKKVASAAPDDSDESSYSLMVGMHSDQATEQIVDIALELKIPFAVVPCCVFPKLFPDRRINSTLCSSQLCTCGTISRVNIGICHAAVEATSQCKEEGADDVVPKPVVSYEDFIIYLKAKSPLIKSRILPFEGRNIVLYTTYS